MLTSLRRIAKTTPGISSLYKNLRQILLQREARQVFENWNVYVDALDHKGSGTVTLRTHNGLQIVIRRNVWDARIIRETFVEKPYVKRFKLPQHPVVVDIGGYIGDFSMYAAHNLQAARVVVYEPTAENFNILQQNIAINDLSDRVVAVNKAVSSSHEITLNTQIDDDEEVHVSAYWYPDAEKRVLPSDTISDIFATHDLHHIDLLKIDCEGGEYDIFPSITDDQFERIYNLVFEFHRIDGRDNDLESIYARLRGVGYHLDVDNDIVSASRCT